MRGSEAGSQDVQREETLQRAEDAWTFGPQTISPAYDYNCQGLRELKNQTCRGVAIGSHYLACHVSEIDEMFLLQFGDKVETFEIFENTCWEDEAGMEGGELPVVFLDTS